jgi:hypothetical protein
MRGGEHGLNSRVAGKWIMSRKEGRLHKKTHNNQPSRSPPLIAGFTHFVPATCNGWRQRAALSSHHSRSSVHPFRSSTRLPTPHYSPPLLQRNQECPPAGWAALASTRCRQRASEGRRGAREFIACAGLLEGGDAVAVSTWASVTAGH